MEELVFSGIEPERVRSRVSQLNECLLTLKAVRRPAAYSAYTDMVVSSRAAIDLVGRERLLALLGGRAGRTWNWLPDAFYRFPASAFVSFEEGLNEAAGDDPERLWAQLIEIHGKVPAVLGRTPADALSNACDVLATYWARVVARRWATIGALLDADVTVRGRQLAMSGFAAMISGLADEMVFDGSSIRMRLRMSSGLRVEVGGDWFVLSPTLVKGEGLYMANDPAAIRVISYPCRGAGTVAEALALGESALSNLIGQARTVLLRSLDEPVSSTALAARLGVTPSAVTQHLKALHDAGLLGAARSSRYVLYRRTALGDALLDAATSRRGGH